MTSLQIIQFLFATELIALSGFPLIVKLFPWSMGYALSLSRVFSQFILAVGLWSLVSIGIISANSFGIIFVLSLLFILGFVLQRDFLDYLFNESVGVNLFYYLVFVFFLILRFLHPEIHWGEKPMDFTFLNYFSRLDSLPPYEPWAAGIQMHYYYGGYFLFSSLLKLSSISPDLGYNLIVAFIPALYFCGLYSVFRVLTVSSGFSILFACLIIFSSSPEMTLGIFRGDKVDSHLFWASTRVYTSPAFTEYPLWTFLFADLHPHFMALPFVSLFLLLLFDAFKTNFRFWQKVLISLNLSFLVLTNAWDGIVCALFLAFFWLASFFYRGFYLRFIYESLVFAILLLLACLPIFFSIKTESAGSIIWAVESEFNTLESIFRIFGFWLIPLSIILIFSFSKKLTRFSAIISLFVSICLLALLASSYHFSGANTPYAMSVVFFSLVLILAFSRLSDQSSWAQLQILGVFSLALFVVVELVVVIDRMNSVFKFHYFLWTSIGIFTLSLFYLYYNRIGKNLILYLTLPFVILSLIGTKNSLLIAYRGFHWNLSGVSRGFDGFDYYRNYNPKDYQIIQWLRKNSKPGSVVAEAYGPSYQEYTRISMNTGLPTVLGWDFHVSQRGVKQEEIQSRKEFLKELYQGEDLARVCRMLRTYKVQYVVISDLERKEYKIPNYRFPSQIPCLTKQFETGTSYILALSSL